jgi:hypothetical protein
VLEFDDADLAGATVADVLADPDKFVGETLADPIEGIAYGRGKAKILRRGDGLIAHSLAHGLSTVYRLLHDAAAIAAAIRAVKPEHAARAFVRGVVAGDVDEIEIDYLVGLTAEIAKCTKTALRKVLKEARSEAAVGVPPVTAANLARIQAALEDEGIVFLSAGQLVEGGIGVRFSRAAEPGHQARSLRRRHP